MVHTPPWVQHFALSDNLMTQWREHGSTMSFLAWCLQTGALDEKRYLHWASKTYQLPLLKDSFLDLPTIDQNWVTGKFLFQWNETLLPLEEWDGIVRIACSEPPDIFQFGLPHAFVLASPRQLRNIWHRFFPQAARAYDPAALLQAYHDHADALESAPSSPEPQLDEHGHPIHDETPAELGVPDGLIATAAVVDIPMPPLALKKSGQPEQKPAQRPETQSESPSAAFAMPTLPGAPEDFDLCDTIDEVVACAFAKMSRHFQYHMALLPNAGSLTPWMWSPTFTRENPMDRPDAIELEAPSFFRIVTRTSMPYHGPTRPSEINDQFFKAWTQSKPITHLTIVPVLINEHAVLTLLGGMDNVIEARAALSDMENWARQAASACERISQKASNLTSSAHAA